MKEYVAPSSNKVRVICPTKKTIPSTTAFETFASCKFNANTLP